MITLTSEEAQQVLDALEQLDGWDTATQGDIVFDPSDEIQILRARLSAPEPEPVAWTVSGLITDFSRDFSAYKTKTYTQALYTYPPQREWQGLTDEEVNKIMWPSPATAYDLARAIEAKLRERNT